MPHHSVARGSAAPSSSKTSTTAAKPTKEKKRAPTGQHLSKSALRAMEKNQHYSDLAMRVVEENALQWKEFLTNPQPFSVRPCTPAEALEFKHLTLARIVAPKGGRQFDVLLVDGKEARLPVAGNIAFHGSARTKEDRVNTFVTGAVAVVHGGQLAACLSAAQRIRIRDAYTHGTAPKGFFASPATEEVEEYADEGWEFDEDAVVEEDEAARSSSDEEEKERMLAKPPSAAAGGCGPILSAKERDAALRMSRKFSKDDDFVDSL